MTIQVCGKAWKYLGQALSERPGVAVSFSVDGGTQKVDLWTATSKVTLRFDRAVLTIAREQVEVARLSLAPTPPASELGAAVVGAALDEPRDGGAPTEREKRFAFGRGRARALRALCCYAQTTQSTIVDDGSASWRAGPLVFSPSGVIRDHVGQIFDVATDGVAAMPAAVVKAKLEALARGEAVDDFPRVHNWWRIKAARKAFFPPHAPKHVVVEQPDTHLTILDHVDLGRDVVNTSLFAGPCVLWSGAAASWFIAADGRAMRFSRDGNMHADPLDLVATALRAEASYAGFDRPLLAGGPGFLAFVDGNRRLRCLFEEPETTPAGLSAQIDKLLATPGHPHEKLSSHHVRTLARAGDLVFATTPGWAHLVLDPRDASWRWTAIADDTESHPREAIAHPSGSPVAVLQSAVTLFDVDTGRHVATVSVGAHHDAVAAAWSHDGHYLVMLRGMDLYAVRVASMQLRHLLTVDDTPAPEAAVSASGEVAFSATGDVVFVSCGSMSIFSWARLVELFRRGDDLPGVRIVAPLDHRVDAGR
jgi:hypothetical protein